MNKLVSFFYVCLSASVLIPLSSLQAIENPSVKHKELVIPRSVAQQVSHVNDLPDEILIRILKFKDLPKASGTVCGRWEILRCDPMIPLRMTITEERFPQLMDGSKYKKQNLFLPFPLNSQQCNELAKWMGSDSISFHLNFAYSKLTDVSALGTAHTLDLNGTFVKDVSALGNVHTLNLRSTPVVDVSTLSNVIELDITATYVNDLSGLKNVKRLYILDGLKDDYFIGLPDLIKRGCEIIRR